MTKTTSVPEDAYCKHCGQHWEDGHHPQCRRNEPAASEPSALADAEPFEIRDPALGLFDMTDQAKAALADAGEPDISELIQELREGVRPEGGMANDVELYDIDGANQKMNEAAEALAALSPGSEQLRRERELSSDEVATFNAALRKSSRLVGKVVTPERLAELEAAESRAVDLARKLEAAKDALEPFAKAYRIVERNEEGDDDNRLVAYSSAKYGVRVKHLRCARATLAKLKESDNG